MLKSIFTVQFLKFIFVGATAAFLNWLSRLGFSIWMPFSAAVALAYVIGMAVAFMLNVLFVFPNSDRPRAWQMRDFVVINLAFLPVVWAGSLVINATLKSLNFILYTEEIAHALALSIPAVATFLLYKFVAFKESL